MSFDRERFANIATQKVGLELVRHHHVVPNCWNSVTDECFSTGLGPDIFDCSGLVIASLCETLGVKIDSWPRNMRHVREFMQDGDSPIGKVMGQETAQRGDLLVFNKIITVEGSRDLYPCHMAIVSSRGGKSEVEVINTSVAEGQVVKEELTDWHFSRIAGAISIDSSKIPKTR